MLDVSKESKLLSSPQYTLELNSLDKFVVVRGTNILIRNCTELNVECQEPLDCVEIPVQ